VRNTFAPGISVLEGARRVWRTMRVLEDAIVVARMENAPNRKLFLLKVGGKTAGNKKDLTELLNRYKSILEDRRQFSPTSGLDTSPEKFGYSNDVYVPLVGDLQAFEVRDLGQGRDVAHIVDLDFFKNKLFAALKVPQSVLGFTDSLPSSLGQSALVRLEIRYARLVKRIKRSYIAFLQQLCMVHCYSLGLHISESDFSIQSMEVSTAEEEERNNALEKLTTTMEALIRFASSLGNVNKDYLTHYIFKSFLRLPDFDVEKFLQAPAGGTSEPDFSEEGEFLERYRGTASPSPVLEGWGDAHKSSAYSSDAKCLPEQFEILLSCEKSISVVVDVLDYGLCCRPHKAFTEELEGRFAEELVDFGDLVSSLVFTQRVFCVETKPLTSVPIKLRVEDFEGIPRFIVSQDTSAQAFLAVQRGVVVHCLVERG